MTVSELSVKVSADTSAAESGLSALGSKVGSAGASIATAFGGAAIAGIAGLTAGLVGSVAAAAGFEAKMSAISAVSGATAAEMEQLTTAALDLGAKTSFSASEAAEGIGELVKAGVSIADVLGGGAAAALNLAAAGGLSVAESAEIASNAMNVFSLKGADVGHVADVIAGAANASAIDVHDFGMSLAASGAVAATVGIGFDDLGTAIAVMGQAGIKGSDAGTSLKTMLLNLTPSTKSQIAAATELGIITADGANRFFDATGKAKSLAEISGVLQEVTSGLTEQQKLQALQTLFGTDAIRAAAVMAKAGSEGFTEMAASIGKVTAEAVAAERLNNLKGDVEQLTGSLETAGIKIGTAFLPGLRSITQGATETVNQAAPVLESFAKRASDAITESSRQIQDAWRTAKQAFAGEWLPSDQIPPFVNAVGTVSTKLGELAGFLKQVGDRAREMGALDTVTATLANMKENSSGIAGNIEGLAAALDRLGGSAGDSEQKVTLAATAIRLLADVSRQGVATIGIVVDSVVQMGRAFVDFQTILLNTGKSLLGWATGNKELQVSAAKTAAEAFQDMWNSSAEWATRTSQNLDEVKAAYTDAGVAVGVLSSDVKTGMDGAAGAAEAGGQQIAAGVESGTTAAQAAAETGMAGVATATETGMGQAVAAVESQAPVAVAAAHALGRGMAAGIEAAAPQMAAAAESGASGAVAAVQAQEGAASGAGQSLGAALGSGLEGGILGYVGRIAAAARQMVSAAIGAGQAEADAHSPSRKTEKLGEDMAEGLEIGLSKSNLGAEMQAKIRDFIEASRAYIPVAGQIARVEAEIKDIRDRGQTDALFRAQEMIDLDSESLRLKENITRLDRDSIGFRQDLAAATREIADAERGTLGERTATIEIDAKRKAIRLETLALEKDLLTVHKNSDRTQFIKNQIDALRDQDRLLAIEAERITTTQSISSTAARIRREQIDDQVRGYDTIIQTIKNQIDTLGAERGVFDANEAVIKNATQNEIDYRNRLIAVFHNEALPLTDRIKAGLALIDQLEKEGRISKDLADRLRDVAREGNAGAAASGTIGQAAATAAPKMHTAVDEARQMATWAAEMARRTAEAGRSVDGLSSSLGRLPNWFTPTGGGGGSQGLFHFAQGGRPPVGIPSIVGERGRELFVPDRPGTIIPADVTRSWMGGGAPSEQTLRVRLEWPDGRQAGQIIVKGWDNARNGGWTPGGLTG